MGENKETGFRKIHKTVEVIWDAFLKDGPGMGLYLISYNLIKVIVSCYEKEVYMEKFRRIIEYLKLDCWRQSLSVPIHGML